MLLPADHPQRHELNDEVHARPPEALTPPCRISYVALSTHGVDRAAERAGIQAIFAAHGVKQPSGDANHFSVDLGPFRLKWERHTEFMRFTIIRPGLGRGGEEDPFAEPAVLSLPEGWLASLPGETLMAAHLALLRDEGADLDQDDISRRLFAGNPLIGAGIAGGSATGLTDLRIRGDGFTRFLVLDRGMTPRQAGRIVQRLLETETYRILALLAFPIARRLAPELNRAETTLARITADLAKPDLPGDVDLLSPLTRLQAEIDKEAVASHYRFSAAAAYHELVRQRTQELRERRIEGMQTFTEFTERRLAPAMNTCRSVDGRQEELSRRIARATQLLSTRVEVIRERQNQIVLRSMDRRARLQLRLQQTVEGLSTAAISYYLVGLVGYLAKAAAAAGAVVSPDLAMGVAVPFVVLFTIFAVRRTRRSLMKGEEGL